MLIPREGGYLVRIYVELDKLRPDERVGGRKAIACEKLGIDGKTLNKWLANDERDD